VLELAPSLEGDHDLRVQEVDQRPLEFTTAVQEIDQTGGIEYDGSNPTLSRLLNKLVRPDDGRQHMTARRDIADEYVKAGTHGREAVVVQSAQR
jgi:hypothetical protein